MNNKKRTSSRRAVLGTVLALTLTSFGGCKESDAVSDKKSEPAPSSATVTAAPKAASASNAPARSAADAKQASVTFRAGTVIEVAYISITPGKEQQLFGDYFPKALPIAMKYGAKPLGIFNVAAGTYTGTRPKMAGFFEWPSVDAFLALHDDPDFQRVVPIRDSALSYLNPGNFFIVEADTTVTFRSDRMYEVWAAWINPGQEKTVKTFQDKIEATATKLGRKNLVSLQPVAASKDTLRAVGEACESHGGEYFPSAIGVVEWPNAAALSAFRESAVYRESEPLLAKALSRIDVLETAFAFPPGS